MASGAGEEEKSHLDRVASVRNALGHVDARLEPFLERPKEEVMRGLPGVDKAKLNVAMAYTMSSLFYVLLKTKGVPTENHEVRTELKRVSESLQQVKRKAAALSGNGDEPTSSTGQRRIRVDTAAGARVIQHALAGAPQQEIAADERTRDKKARNTGPPPHSASPSSSSSSSSLPSKKKRRER